MHELEPRTPENQQRLTRELLETWLLEFAQDMQSFWFGSKKDADRK